MKQFNIYTPFSVVTKSTDSEKPMEGIRIAGYANTTDKDRGGDIVLTSAWAKGIDNFKKNPVLLLQHNHNQPIGRVETLKIDNKGLYVEAYISPAAEKQYSTITLINDSVLKSFSVGFVPKKIKQPMDNTTNNIVSELELLEISVVAVPMNQNSLFSIKKSFNSESEYTSYLKNDVEVEKTINISTKTSLMASGHYHIFEIGENDSGISVYASHGQKHVHKLINGQVEEVNGHSHELAISEIEPKEIEISLSSTDTLIDKEEPVIESVKEVPKELIFNDPNVKYITENTFVRLKNKRYKTINIATPENPTFKFLQVDLNGVSNDNSVIEIKSDDLSVIDAWNIGTTYDLRISDLQLSNDLTEEIKNIISQNYDDLIKVSEIELYKVKTSNQQQQQLINKLLNLKSTPRNEWATNEYRFAEYLTAMVKELITLEDSEDRNLALALHGYDLEIKKENIQMTTQPTQPAGDVLVVPSTKGSAEAPAGSVSVAEPRVAELVEKTGAAIMAEADAQDKQVLVKNVEVPYTPRESEELAELKAQVNKYKDQIASLQNTKMQFQESNRNTTRFTSKELNDAFLLSKALNVGVYETNLGAKMKAVTTVDQFLSNFSTSVYEEMQQQLVVAPMFRRLAVDARNFRIPVSDEDTNGDVAQFQSGTFAQSISDTTRVPTTRQNTITAVTLTPHKFMATTHLAKDEEEDTILPLIDFLRMSATRRLARALDKALLRGDGSLTGFNASPTNAITVGSGYESVFKGVVTLANDITGLRTDIGASAKADPADIATARGKLGKYGLQLGNDLVFVTSVEGYNSLITHSEFRTVDKFGPNATLLTGAVGAVYGIPVVVTEFLDVAGSSNNQVGLLLYKPGFIVGERRAIEVESEYEPRQQVTALYMSTRFDMKALTTNADAALDATKYSYASVLRSA